MLNESEFRYRTDIDGLRAIAVCAVVLFHAGVPGFGGGYIGVDIFFVISGYLITSLISPAIDARSFSIRGFYQRRVRRIFPALIVVIAFCIAAGYFLLSPKDYQKFGTSVIATGAFVSNVFFWQQTSYFGAPASQNPLLHTWSLAIEEQFYLFYPLFLVLISKASRLVRDGAMLATCFVSFMACALLIYYKPSATFFLGPTRAWELLLGGIIALGVIPKSNYRSLNSLASFVGLIFLVFGITIYSSSMRYPGYAALAPVVGSGLLIWSGQFQGTIVHKILSTSPFVAIGQASYSFYLWHFPLFAYFEYVKVGKIAPHTIAEIIVIALIAAFLSLRFVERPFRFPTQKAAVPRLVLIALLGMVALIGVGAFIEMSGGVPSRMDAVSATYLEAESDEIRHHRECMSVDDTIVKVADACKLGAADVNPTALLWGDSHAMVTATALEHAALKAKAAFYFAASVDCPPGIGFSIEPKIGPSFVATPGYQYCEKYNNDMLELALNDTTIQSVVLSSRWTNWHVGEPGSPTEGSVDIRLRDDTGDAPSLRDNEAIFVRGFKRLLQALIMGGKTVWIVGPEPEATVRVPKALYIKHLGYDTSDIDIPVESYLKRNKTIFSIFADIAKEYPVNFIWPQQVLCSSTTCPVEENGKPLYLDDNHLSIFGALKTARLYDVIFAKSPRAKR